MIVQPQHDAEAAAGGATHTLVQRTPERTPDSAVGFCRRILPSYSAVGFRRHFFVVCAQHAATAALCAPKAATAIIQHRWTARHDASLHVVAARGVWYDRQHPLESKQDAKLQFSVNNQRSVA